MESTALKAENLKPIILKAGVPLAVSLAGFIYAWITAKKSLSKASPLSENEASSPETNCNQGTKHEECSHSLPSMENEEPATPLASSVLSRRLVIHDNPSLEQEITALRNRIELLEYYKSENRILQRKVQKLLRKSKGQSRLIKDKSLKIKAEEAEVLRNRDALQTRISVIYKLEDENKKLQSVLHQLQDEKNELLHKLDTAEKAYAFKVEAGDGSKEGCNQLLSELDQVKKERAAGVEELIHLRSSNACLMRHHEQQQQQRDQDRDHIELEFEGNGGVMHYDSGHELHDSFLEHHKVPCFGSSHSDRSRSKRRMLLKRLKRWVEGSEKLRVKPEEKYGHEIKCLGRHSVSYGAKDPQVPATARRSCSSA